MRWNARQGALGLVGWLGLIGCASTDPRPAITAANQLAAERSGLAAPWLAGEPEREGAAKRSREILAAPLSGEGAAELALLNNPALQARLEDLGVAQADLAQATRLANPRFAWADLRSGAARQQTLAFEIEIVDWLVQPLRRKMAEGELEKTRYEVGSAILEVAGEARKALLEFQAEEQMAARLAAMAEVAAAAAEFSQKLFEAGNVGALDLAQYRAASAQARADLAQTRGQARQRRERVNRALGLDGEAAAWTAVAELPELPAQEADLSQLERLAFESRLDLAAARSGVDLVGRALALKRKTRFLPVGIDLGIEREREVGGATLTGPTIALQLPLFDTGRASIARLESEERRARWQLAALTGRARSEVRENRDALAAARERATLYREELLPLRAEILDLTLRHYNMMLRGTYDVLQARQRQVEAERAYLEALRDYWSARLDLEQAVGGRWEKQP
jgi:cobalt-zinc-cadmium efflux system outer membrane protein